MSYLKPITQDDWQRMLDSDPYYRGRWAYFSEVAKMVDQIQPQSVVELGPHKLPICPDGDTIDVSRKLDPTYRFDAAFAWPQIDRHYDLFIGLQVFEHLRGQQERAFANARAIADHVILSIPYKWEAGDVDHLGLTERDAIEWAEGVEPDVQVLAGPRWIGWWKP